MFQLTFGMKYSWWTTNRSAGGIRVTILYVEPNNHFTLSPILIKQTDYYSNKQIIIIKAVNRHRKMPMILESGRRLYS